MGSVVAVAPLSAPFAGAAATGPVIAVTPAAIPLIDRGPDGPGAATDRGELVSVRVSSNSILRPETNEDVMECQAHVLTSHSLIDCDPLTAVKEDPSHGLPTSGFPYVTGPDGSMTARYLVFDLPTSHHGFDWLSKLQVGPDHPLVLWIGSDFIDSFSSGLLSSPITLGSASVGQSTRSSNGSTEPGSKVSASGGSHSDSSDAIIGGAVALLVVGAGGAVLRKRRRASLS
jgi:hypothetical protein